MAIQPIDLQTLYTQLEKVSKMTAHQQQGLQLQKAIQQEEQAKRLQEKQKTVEKVSMDEDGFPVVSDHNKAITPNEDEDGDHQREPEKDEAIPEKLEIIKDPKLGQHIDISG